jgi:hypothetical protein
MHIYFVRKPKGKKPLGKPGRRWEEDIKMCTKEICLRIWIGLIWLTIVVGSSDHGNEPSGSMKGGEFLD